MMTNSSWCIVPTTKRWWHLSLSERHAMHRWERLLRLLRECLFALPLILPSRNYEQHCGLRPMFSRHRFLERDYVLRAWRLTSWGRRKTRPVTSATSSTWIVQFAYSTDKTYPSVSDWPGSSSCEYLSREELVSGKSLVPRRLKSGSRAQRGRQDVPVCQGGGLGLPMEEISGALVFREAAVFPIRWRFHGIKRWKVNTTNEPGGFLSQTHISPSKGFGWK